jgi:hypothetical protein
MMMKVCSSVTSITSQLMSKTRIHVLLNLSTYFYSYCTID